MRLPEGANLEPCRWRSDPCGVFDEALRKRRSLRPLFYSLLAVTVALALTYLFPPGIFGWVSGLALLVFVVIAVLRFTDAWAMGGWTTRRWAGADVMPRFVYQASEVIRTDSDGDEWVQWVVLELLPREPRKDEIVLHRRYLTKPRLGVDPRLILKPEVVRIRCGIVSSCKAATFADKTVLMATARDGTVTVLCVPPDGAIYRIGRAPAVMAGIDRVREWFS